MENMEDFILNLGHGSMARVLGGRENFKIERII